MAHIMGEGFHLFQPIDFQLYIVCTIIGINPYVFGYTLYISNTGKLYR